MKRLLIACGLAAAGVAAVAQPPDLAAVGKNAGQKARENAVALKQYGWTMHVAVTLKGEPKPLKLFAMRFDLEIRDVSPVIAATTSQRHVTWHIFGRVKLCDV